MVSGPGLSRVKCRRVGVVIPADGVPDAGNEWGGVMVGDLPCPMITDYLQEEGETTVTKVKLLHTR